MTQLVELQEVLPSLAEAGVAVYAVSYDSVAILDEFATREGVTFPLLSDEGSRVIDALGLRNEHVFEQQAVYGFAPNEAHLGVPYPGVFTLDRDGVVVDKAFFQSYRERETGQGMLGRSLGIDLGIDSPSHGVELEAVRVEVRLDAPDWKPYQRLYLTVDLDMPAGHHIYADPVPGGLEAARIEVDALDGLEIGSQEWPEAGRLWDGGLMAEVRGYQGSVRAAVPLTFTMGRGTGTVVVSGRLRLQVCTPTVCLPPGQVPFELPLAEGRFVRPAPK